VLPNFFFSSEKCAKITAAVVPLLHSWGRLRRCLNPLVVSFFHQSWYIVY